jgi:hypothetical protein
MQMLSRNWWKLLLITIITLLVRVLMLQLLPLSPTFELPLSSLSQTIGMIPTAAFMFALSCLAIGSVLVLVQQGVSGGTITRAATCALAFGAFWFLGVLETVPSLGKPLGPELIVGAADIVPIITLCVLTSLWTFNAPRSRRPAALRESISGILIIALMYFVGRYFLYAVVHVNSGYLTQPAATFAWTLAMGGSVGLMYALLKDGVRGKTPWQRGLWFGGVVFGILWALFNLFMPVVFDVSFIAFDPPLLNYVWRVVVDILCVAAGVWLVER